MINTCWWWCCIRWCISWLCGHHVIVFHQLQTHIKNTYEWISHKNVPLKITSHFEHNKWYTSKLHFTKYVYLIFTAGLEFLCLGKKNSDKSKHNKQFHRCNLIDRTPKFNWFRLARCCIYIGCILIIVSIKTIWIRNEIDEPGELCTHRQFRCLLQKSQIVAWSKRVQ